MQNASGPVVTYPLLHGLKVFMHIRGKVGKIFYPFPKAFDVIKEHGRLNLLAYPENFIRFFLNIQEALQVSFDSGHYTFHVAIHGSTLILRLRMRI